MVERGGQGFVDLGTGEKKKNNKKRKKTIRNTIEEETGVRHRQILRVGVVLNIRVCVCLNQCWASKLDVGFWFAGFLTLGVR